MGAAAGLLTRLHLGVQRRGLLGLESVARRVNRLRGRKPLPPHLLTGIRGELEALFFLRRQGYVIAARRWRSPDLNGDLDLVAWDGETLCFVEVKTRTKRDKWDARLAVDGPKQRILRRMARLYRNRALPREQRADQRYRFDVVSVYLVGGRVECELLRQAFDAAEESYSPRAGV